MSNKINMKTVDGLEEGLANKADIDLSNSPYTTNRILEIPQNIKLEFNSGTVTLKAGSKVYVPNGFEADGTTPKFDVYTTTSDVSLLIPDTITTSHFLFWTPSTNTFNYRVVTSSYSGTSDTGSGTTFYNTSTNIITSHNNGGDVQVSFPIALFTKTSIDQIFNGLGYIGLVAFALPGIKIQYVQGTNIDGTYNTGVDTTTSMLFVSLSANYPNSRGCLLSYSPSTQTFGLRMAYEIGNVSMVPSTGRNYSFMFCEQDGWFYVTENTTTYSKSTQVFVRLGWFYQKSATEASVKIDTVNAINTYHRSELSGLGKHSSRYEDWTLLASGNSYTAPANGHILFGKAGSGTGQVIQFIDDSGTLVNIPCAYNGHIPILYVDVRKGQTFTINYSVTGTTSRFRFIYDVGEN